MGYNSLNEDDGPLLRFPYYPIIRIIQTEMMQKPGVESEKVHSFYRNSTRAKTGMSV
jgi:hypothetical protein